MLFTAACQFQLRCLMARNAMSSCTLDFDFLAAHPYALVFVIPICCDSFLGMRVVQNWCPRLDSRWNREERTFQDRCLLFTVFTLSHSMCRNLLSHPLGSSSGIPDILMRRRNLLLLTMLCLTSKKSLLFAFSYSVIVRLSSFWKHFSMF